jgi:hypothetical protein
MLSGNIKGVKIKGQVHKVISPAKPNEDSV